MQKKRESGLGTEIVFRKVEVDVPAWVGIGVFRKKSR